MFELLLLLILVVGFISLFLFLRKINNNWEKNNEEQEHLINFQALRINTSIEHIGNQDKNLNERLDSVFNVLDLLVSNHITITNELTHIQFLLNSQYLETIKRELLAVRDNLGLMSEIIMNHKKLGIEVTNEMVIAFKSREAEIISLEEKIQKHEKEV